MICGVNRMKKRIISLLLVMCMVCALLPMGAMAASTGTLDDPWTSGGAKVYRDGSTLHVYGTGSMGDFAKKEDAPWYSISGNIGTIVIEGSIEYIGKNAFSACGSATKVVLKRDLVAGKVLGVGENGLPSNYTVDLVVFGAADMLDGSSNQLWDNFKTKVVSITIEDGVKSIGKQAFAGCDHVTTVTIPGTVTKIGQEAFYRCDALTTVNWKRDYNDGAMEALGTNAFPTGNSGFTINFELEGGAMPDYAEISKQPWASVRDYIKTLVVDSPVTRIGNNAFNGCNYIKSVTMYFADDGSKVATKELGANWYRENYDQSVNVKATSENNVFNRWTGDCSVTDATSANTVLNYNRFGGSVTANWSEESNKDGDLFLRPAIAFNAPGGYTFGRVDVGYGEFAPYTVTLYNYGNYATGELVVEMTGGRTDAFTLSTKYLSSLGRNQSVTFSVTPKTGFGLGTYNSTVYISNKEGNPNNVSVGFNVEFVVSNARSRAEEYVTLLYNTFLPGGHPHLDSDPGFIGWVDGLVGGQYTAAQVAASIISSEECLKYHKMSDEQFVENLYKGLMARGYDAQGKQAWLGAINAGKSRCWVFKSFVDSGEFIARCNNLTIVPGTVAADGYNMEYLIENVDRTKAEALVQHLYSTILGHAPDAAGLNSWTDALVNKKATAAQVAASIYASPEYRQKNTTNKDFVVSLYKSLLGRTSDPTVEEMKAHLDALNAGASRSQIFVGFVGTEFQTLCNSYDLTRGSVDASQYDMSPITGSKEIVTNKMSAADADAFVDHLYQTLLKHAPDAQGKSLWSGKLQSGEMTGSQVAACVCASTEFKDQLAALPEADRNPEFVTRVFEALLYRSVDSDALKAFSDSLTLKDKTRCAVFAEIAASTECLGRFSEKGITTGGVKDNSYPM